MKLIDLTGEKFGNLTVIGRGDNDKSGHVRWKCKCDCGKIKEKPVYARDLKVGKVVSCGCIHHQKITIHNGSKERLYQTWKGMLKRCENPNCTNFHNYGKRGIKVCDEWKDYLTFKAWALKTGYKERLTIDRINVNGNYTPDNCRWVTLKEQSNNKRNNVYTTINGEKHTLAEWAELAGVNKSTIRQRYHKGVRGELLLSKSLRKVKNEHLKGVN